MPMADETKAAIIRRAVLFKDLAKFRNEDRVCAGIGYADFIRVIYKAPNFAAVRGHNYKNIPDTPWVLEHAFAVTKLVGRIQVGDQPDKVINAGMDTFIWNSSGDRPDGAFTSKLPYSRTEWERVFPTGDRMLLEADSFGDYAWGEKWDQLKAELRERRQQQGRAGEDE